MLYYSQIITDIGGIILKNKGVIFDLDGTLWNTTEIILPVWNRVLSEHREADKQLSAKEMDSYMGKTLREIASLMLPNLPIDKALSILKECCKAECPYLEKVGGNLYEGVESTLQKLSKDYSLCIVSNCQDGYLQAFLNYHGFNDCFIDFEMSGRTGKTKGENIRMVIERNNIEEAVYIGDTQSDFDAAKQAGVPFILAEYGFGKGVKSDYSIKCFSDISSEIKKIFKEL